MHRVICETEAGFIIGVSQTSVTIGSGRKMAVFSLLLLEQQCLTLSISDACQGSIYSRLVPQRSKP